jgi:hypothetical protein
MGAIDAFDVMTDAVSRNPILLGAAAVIGVASTVLNTAGQIPLVGLLVGLLYFLVEPYLAGGFLGMANQAVSGDTSFDDFTTSASDHYSDLLVARLVVAIPFVIYLVLVSLVGVLALVPVLCVVVRLRACVVRRVAGRGGDSADRTRRDHRDREQCRGELFQVHRDPTYPVNVLRGVIRFCRIQAFERF